MYQRSCRSRLKPRQKRVAPDVSAQLFASRGFAPITASAAGKTPDAPKPFALTPPPPPGGEDSHAGHLPRWPGRRIKCPKGHAGVHVLAGKRVDRFNPPDRQERCLALALGVTRKHRSAAPPALRGAPMPARTGGAVEARVASREIKA